MEIGLLLILQDQNGVSHRQKPITFTDETTIKELSEAINSFWFIHQNYQELYHNGKQIISLKSTLKQIGVKDDDEIVIKHSELSRWTAYKKCLDLVLKKTDDKKANARDAVRHHELLMKCGFFDAYLQFDDYRKQKHSKVASWTDGDINLIRDAAEQYFHRLHDLKRGNQESDFICNFEDQDLELGGRSTSTLAFVRIHGEDFVSKFYIKCHHFGPKDTSSGQPPDINELYCYKLLELIAVGPTCHIVPPIITSGTKQAWVWKGTNNIAIVDFAPENEITVHDDIKAQLFTTFPHSRWKEEFKAVKNKLDDNSWLKIAKQNLDKWGLSRKIELAQEQLDPTKDVLKGIELGFKKRKLCYSPTDQLKQYVDILNKNLENLQIVLNSTVH
ncbi:unnamed protein product [Caenorhabditis sp. 36 PRJEB53466]|nr:unnamed protein product [Caenorhabditis sp. 36 PRJEB53466]